MPNQTSELNWEARIWAIVNAVATCVQNPTEGFLLTQSIKEHNGDLYRDTRSYFTTHHRVFPIARQIHKLNKQASRAMRDRR